MTSSADAPFNVSYTYPAFYDAYADDQDIELTATLTPKTYDITYDLGIGGGWPAGTTHATKHTWSKETPINVIPVRSGYVFDGWVSDVNGAYVDGKITAATAQAVTLTAKWIKIEVITFIGESGEVEHNGSEQSLSGVTVDGLPAGYTYEGLSYSAKGTNVGTYTGSFSGTVTVRNGAVDVTDHFRFLMVPGTLVIKTTGTPTPPPTPPTPPTPPDEPEIPGTGSVILTKVDSADRNTTLADVVFNLYQANGTLVGTYTTGSNGTIRVNDLPVGGYYWVEIRPAEGYMLDAAKRAFTVYGGELSRVTVYNTRTPVPDVFSGDHYAYIIGYDDGLVHPEANITRAEVATIFFRLLDDATRAQYMTRENNFPDVEEGMWFNTAVSTMAAMGIVNGYPDGNFHPNAYITRAEFAAVAARFDPNGNITGASFSDIYGHWAQDEINQAYNNGWILGYDGGTIFKPDQNITRAEAMTLINRVLQRVPENSSDLLRDMVKWYDNMDATKWYYLAVQEATNSHDYGRKGNGYEYWVKLREIRDWSALER